MTYNFLEEFPLSRMRRSRLTPQIRNLVAENNLNINNLILPLFVCEGSNIKDEITNLPLVFRYSIDNLLKLLEQVVSLGINAIMLFPVIDDSKKDEIASEAINPNNLICRAIRAIKIAFPDIIIIADVALDPYNITGHDGIIDDRQLVLNDETIDILVKQSLIQSWAGCDFIAPSDMMDGRIIAIRKALDHNNLKNTSIISYSAKYASNFYGPFRDAVGSRSSLKGNKKNYQMDFANSDEALREIAMDIKEGADAIIVKPALPYLDIISRAKNSFPIPIFAYQVSGEHSMIYFAAKNNAFDFISSYYESLLSIKRAGARAIITYLAIDIAIFLKNNQ
jgi:porphobilinogen synthase